MLGRRVLSTLTDGPKFISAAPLLQIVPPLFNRYAASHGHQFGLHVDNAVRGDRLTGLRIRSHLSVMLFPSEPDGYDGSEAMVETSMTHMRSSSGLGTSCIILRLGRIWSRRSHEVCVWHLFSGCRAWYGMPMRAA